MKNGCLIGCGSIMVLFVVIVLATLFIGTSVDNNIRTNASAPRTYAAQKKAVTMKKELTRAQYDALQTGMTVEQVAQILGSPGEEQSASQVETNSFKTSASVRMYKGDGIMSGIVITFSDGRLLAKSQYGLE